jgi:non-heme chloroperoxidase
MTMGMVNAKDGTGIFYKDWGEGRPVVFSHGWPLNADAWDEQLYFVASNGMRAIAHDRRGHGRSGQAWKGNDMDTYADDLAAVMDKLDLRDVILVGHSTGGGEITRYMGRHGTKRVAKAVLVDAVPPGLIKAGVPKSVFDEIRQGLSRDRAQYYKDFSVPFYGANREGNKVSQGLRDFFWMASMGVDFKAAYDCVRAFSETDFTEDLKKINIPVLVIHGDDDQIVPIDISARKTVSLLPRATLKVYPGAPHGLTATHRDQFNADLLAFIQDKTNIGAR